MHLFLYAPLLFLWIGLSGQTPDPETGYNAFWYTYWINFVHSALIPVFITLQSAWIIVIIIERDNEDESFSLIEPILAAIFYFFIGFSTLGAIYCDWWKAVAYYDKDEI